MPLRASYLIADVDRRFAHLVPDAQHRRFLCSMTEGDHQTGPLRFVSDWRALLEPE